MGEVDFFRDGEDGVGEFLRREFREGLPPAFKAELEGLRREADESIRRLRGSDEPLVIPVGFKLVLGAAWWVLSE